MVNAKRVPGGPCRLPDCVGQREGEELLPAAWVVDAKIATAVWLTAADSRAAGYADTVAKDAVFEGRTLTALAGNWNNRGANYLNFCRAQQRCLVRCRWCRLFAPVPHLGAANASEPDGPSYVRSQGVYVNRIHSARPCALALRTNLVQSSTRCVCAWQPWWRDESMAL